MRANCKPLLLVAFVWTVPLMFCAAPVALPGEGSSQPPNLLVDVSRDFTNNAVGMDIDRVDPVVDEILKSKITGMGRTVAKTRVEFIPDENRAIIDFVTVGQLFTDTVGVNGPVKLYSDGTTQIRISKRVFITGDGLTTGAVDTNASNQSYLKGISTKFRGLVLNCLVTNIARSQFYKKKSQAECIAARHAEQQYNEQTDKEAIPKLEEADQSLKKALDDVRKEGVKLEYLRFATSRDTLFVRASLPDPKQPNIASPPPAQPGAYLAARLHETLVNQAAQASLAGKTITGEQIEKEAKKLGGKESGDTEWSVTFPKERPVVVNYADGGFRMLMRLAEFTSGDDEYSGMDVSVAYKFEQKGDEIKAVRQGQIEALPPGYVKGKALSGRQQVMRTILQKRFGKIFKQEIVFEPLALPDDMEKAGPLEVTHAQAERGWLNLAWRQGKRETGKKLP